jgi:Flp pilus assembly protein TadD
MDRVLRLELSQLLLQTGRPEQARPVLEQLVSEQSSDIPSLDALIRTQFALKDFAAARNSVSTMQRQHPDVPLGFHLDGVLNEMEGKLENAYVAYSRALELEPSAAEPLAAITRVDVARKQADRAMERLDKYITEQPKNVIARNLKGELQLTRQDASGAVKTFSDTLQIADSWWVAYRGLALAQVASNDTDAAIATLERGIAKSRETATLANELAALYERLGRSDDAISTYEKLLQREPRSVGAANNLAMLLVTYRTDESSLNRARELVSSLSSVDDPAVLNTRGWVMFKRGEYQESLPLLQQAVDKSPQSPVMRYHLGMAQLRSGDQNAARENLEAAIATGKPFPGAKEAQAALDEIKRPS